MKIYIQKDNLKRYIKEIDLLSYIEAGWEVVKTKETNKKAKAVDPTPAANEGEETVY